MLRLLAILIAMVLVASPALALRTAGPAAAEEEASGEVVAGESGCCDSPPRTNPGSTDGESDSCPFEDECSQRALCSCLSFAMTHQGFASATGAGTGQLSGRRSYRVLRSPAHLDRLTRPPRPSTTS